MSGELSYLEALTGVVSENELEGLVGLVQGHKNWGAFMTRIPSHIVVNLIDEIKRLRQLAGGFKSSPNLPDVSIGVEELEEAQLDDAVRDLGDLSHPLDRGGTACEEDDAE